MAAQLFRRITIKWVIPNFRTKAAAAGEIVGLSGQHSLSRVGHQSSPFFQRTWESEFIPESLPKIWWDIQHSNTEMNTNPKHLNLTLTADRQNMQSVCMEKLPVPSCFQKTISGLARLLALLDNSQIRQHADWSTCESSSNLFYV